MQAQQLLVPSYFQAYTNFTEAFKTQRHNAPPKYYDIADEELANNNTQLENHIVNQVKTDGLWLSFGTPKTDAPNFLGADKQNQPAGKLFSFAGPAGNYDIQDINKPEVTIARKGGLLLGLKPQRPEQVHISTLADFLFWKPQPCAFVHINCESYSSTITILNALYSNNRIVSGTVLLFDSKLHLQLLKTMNAACFAHLWDQKQVDIPSSIVQRTNWAGVALKQR
ncbi:hypothetical protein KXQ82_03380 [Mucilaginibacter sp. HMF5004]|uniref:hypothetical protein n=1 Tax=Mucilaginibacter rivuli TaxID=2857527 RepID=UPI001C5FFCFA|nr:hypothetical protein [Mucilaginibacter rivuli]MBW4888736.1 hypothetical protein [Mucilaginibacter rivuli]